MRYIAIVLLCCALGLAKAHRPELTVLHASSEKPLNVPSFPFFGPPQSDSKGDIFIHPAPYEEINILKITVSLETVIYKIPDAEGKKYSFYAYSVTPDGVVWVLATETGSPMLD